MQGRVFWITGFSGVGKTTIGTRLYYRLKENYPHVVLLDGDVIKKLFGVETVDYSAQGRKRRAFQYAELCKLLSSQGITVVCCTIAMFDDVRGWNRKNITNYYEIFIDADFELVMKRDAKGLYKKFANDKGLMVGVSGDTELPKKPDIVIHNNVDGNVEQYVDEILLKLKDAENHDVSYWNGYYKTGCAPRHPSDFARFVTDYIESGKKLIDLGCGNGRDSMYFCEQGLKVTAIDSSAEAIASIDKSLPIFAVCDSFVTANALFCVDYNYCYARWSIHAITQAQQDELFPNVYNALKDAGLFFIEARTINDVKYGKGKQLGPDEYLYDNHYRRFINPSLLIKQLENTGFKILFNQEANHFSVVEGDAPMLFRVIAQKGGN